MTALPNRDGQYARRLPRLPDENAATPPCTFAAAALVVVA